MVRTLVTTSLAAALSLAAAAAAAQTTTSASVEADTSLHATSEDTGNASNEGAVLLAGKVGGILPFAGFTPFVSGGVELGYVFGGTERRMAALLDVTYTTPLGDGKVTDDRFKSGDFTWEITQKELVLQPTFMYRITGLQSIVPYIGIGPRIYFLRTLIEGKSGGKTIEETKEQSTKFGVGLPLGIEYTLGPGGLFAELLFQWGPLDHEITGDTHLGAGTLFLGYRALL